MFRLFRSILCGIVILSLAACSSLSWHKPEVSLAGVKWEGGGLLQQKLTLKLLVVNKNDVDISVDALNFEILVEDKAFAEGGSAQPSKIPRNGEGIVEVQTRAHVLGLMTRLPQLVAADGLLHYRLRGTARIHGYGEIPFDHPGTLDPDKLGGLKNIRNGL